MVSLLANCHHCNLYCLNGGEPCKCEHLWSKGLEVLTSILAADVDANLIVPVGQAHSQASFELQHNQPFGYSALAALVKGNGHRMITDASYPKPLECFYSFSHSLHSYCHSIKLMDDTFLVWVQCAKCVPNCLQLFQHFFKLLHGRRDAGDAYKNLLYGSQRDESFLLLFPFQWYSIYF